MFTNVSAARWPGKRTILVAALMCLFSISAFAQNSGISGSVADPSNALVPGVTVVATNLQTGVTQTTISNESGTYNFVALQPGSYKLSASLPGFQTQTFNNYQVGAGEQLRLNFTLTVATTQTAVEVNVDASALIATSSSSIGQVLTSNTVQNLPLVGEDVLQLIGIMPGVVAENFAGVASSQVNTVRDGLSVSDGRFQNGVFATTVINPDLVGEVRLILAPVDAELGRGNGQVIITTRSGTNRFAGSAVWNIRNTALNANTWSNNRNVDDVTGAWSPTQPNWTNNHQYSLSFGGPIIKNKTFFFVLWDQQLNYQRTLQTGSVLTDSARNGIFRYFPGWTNGNAEATTSTTGANPTTAVVDFQGNPKPPATSPTGGAQSPMQCFSVFGDVKFDGSPFTAADCPGGNAIVSGSPWDSFRPVSDPTGYIRKIIDAMPHANYFGAGPANSNFDGLNKAGHRWTLHRQGNQGAAVTTGDDLNSNRTQINIKIDQNFNASHKLSVGYTRERNTTDSDVPLWPDGINYRTHRWPQVFTSNFTSTLSSTLLNEARFGIRYEDAGIDAPWEDQFGDQDVIDAARALMLPGSNNYAALINAGAGNYAFGGNSSGIMNTNPGQYNGNKSPLYSVGDTLSWTRGQHGFKFGGEYRYTESNGYNNSPAGGGAVILYPRVSGGAGNQTSALAGTVAALTGLNSTNRTDVANMLYFLAGSVNSASQTYWINAYSDVAEGTWHDTNDQSTGGRKYRPVVRQEYSGFFKDDWKIKRRLTLNLGVRYEFYGSPYIKTGFTSTTLDTGDGLFGVGRATNGDAFSNWLQPGNVFLTGYGPGASPATALTCVNGQVQSALLPTSNCDPSLLTTIEFIGPKTPNPKKTAVRLDRNNFGPAVGFAWEVPWFGEGKTTVRGGYQISYGGSGRTVGGGGTTADETVVGLAPGSLSTPTTVLADFSGQYLDLRSIQALVPIRPTSPALPGSPVPIAARASNFSSYDPNYATPYTQNFTLSINRRLTNKVTLDLQYIGTVSKKLQGSYNINTSDVFYNQELLDALTLTRAGGDSPLLDQMFAGLNINNGVAGYGPVGTCVTQAAGSTAPGLGLEGCASNQVMQHASAHLRRTTAAQGGTQIQQAIANGNFNTVAQWLNTNGGNLPANGATGGLTNSPITGVGGRLLRNGCDRMATGQATVSAQLPIPMRCFAENYLTINPQLGTPTYITSSGNQNYHSLQIQATLRPTHGFSYQATYTWSKNLAMPGTTFTDPLDRNAEYSYAGSHRAHDFRSNGSFELPFGPNKLLGANTSGWVARLIERWQASLILNMTTGSRNSLGAQSMFYANGVPDAVSAYDLSQGKVTWGDSSNANGQLQGDYFGVGKLVKVDDPQCATANVTDRMGYNPYAAGQCTIDALQDSATGKIVLQHPQPGKRGTAGRNTIENPGTWRFDANMSKTFQLTESKSLQIRMDATNILNHPNVNNPTFDINSNTAFGIITAKGNDVRTFQGQLRLTF
jgi:hypothetical protein